MTLRPRFKHSLLVVACTCAALAASPVADSQSPAAPQGQEAQPVSQAQADQKPGFGDNPVERRMAYSSFLIGMANYERGIQEQLAHGLPIPRSQIDWAKLLRIREDEAQAMRAISADAQHRIKEIDDRVYASDKERMQNPSAENQEKFRALMKEIAGQGDGIVDETITKLRQELGEEDFKKLDDYVYRTCGYHPKPSEAAPAQGQDSQQSAKNQAAPGSVVRS